jgi:hypothetical protein
VSLLHQVSVLEDLIILLTFCLCEGIDFGIVAGCSSNGRMQSHTKNLCFAVIIIVQLLVLHGSPSGPNSIPTKSLPSDCNITKLDLPGRQCALNLYGLPRSFKDLVLPSLIKNVIIPNIHYDCDYFVHFYNVTHEPPSRSGGGGSIMPEDVYLLRDAVHRIALRAGRQLPYVGFTLDTEEKFERKHDDLLRTIRNETVDNPFLWLKGTFTVGTHVNIIKMWYSISAVWDFMKEHASFQNIRYERVAMMRSDVVYLTPIDVFKSAPDGIFDTFNNQSVIPGFARYPVNDRMFYGPYEATEIWATGRFSRLDDYIYRLHRPLHSEAFLAATILPAIRALKVLVNEDPGICFWRARADRTVWSDCGGLPFKGLLENLLNRNCSEPVHPAKIGERRQVLTCFAR